MGGRAWQEGGFSPQCWDHTHNKSQFCAGIGPVQRRRACKPVSMCSIAGSDSPCEIPPLKTGPQPTPVSSLNLDAAAVMLTLRTGRNSYDIHVERPPKQQRCSGLVQHTLGPTTAPHAAQTAPQCEAMIARPAATKWIAWHEEKSDSKLVMESRAWPATSCTGVAYIANLSCVLPTQGGAGASAQQMVRRP